MMTYSILMFAMAASFAVLAVKIYRGKTDLIMEHHQTRVTDLAAYGRAYGKALAVIAGALLAGLGIGVAAILIVQKKYNNGLF